MKTAMKVIEISTGKEYNAVYAANSSGNLRMNVNGKFYQDKAFGKKFRKVESA